MGKWCLHASSFIFDQIVIKVAGNQDRHKSSDKFDFGPLVSMAHLYVFEMRFDLGTLDSGEQSLPFGLLVDSSNAKPETPLMYILYWSRFCMRVIGRCKWVAKDPSFLHADSKDWSDWADAQADLSLRWAHIPLHWFCHVVAQILQHLIRKMDLVSKFVAYLVNNIEVI